MLNPNNDRLDYGQILAPPAGYCLDFAVGTTYSLDLDALVGASLAMGLSEETDSELMNNPVCLLEALRSTGDKVALFCEGGQIHMPSKVTSLYVLLEKMVFSVKTAKHRGLAAFPSFHPKIWLLRYKNNVGELLYRVVVLSRNLTFDRSWDITYYMDGKLTKTQTEKNRPVCDFLQYLTGFLSSNPNGRAKAKLIRGLIKELLFVNFEPAEKEFYDYEFLPNGIRREDGSYYQITETPLFKDTFHDVLIISPFLTGSILRGFNDRNNRSLIENSRYFLITREMSLGKLKPEDVSRFRLFTMRDMVVDGETAISDSSAEVQKQDIHAKVYMTRKYSDANLYLGSLNASHNAVHGNIEFMLLLRSKNRYLNIDKLSVDLFGAEKDGSDNPFQEVTLQNAILDEEDERKKVLDGIIKDINRSNPKASVTQESEKTYSVSIHFGKVDLKGCQVTVRPLLSKKTEAFENDIRFDLFFTKKLLNRKALRSVIRSAEMCLIMAESYAHLNNTKDALYYLNLIRSHRISSYTDYTENSLPVVDQNALIQTDATGKALTPLLAAILNERRKEFYMENGDRWFELKRNGCPEFWWGYAGVKYETQKFLYTFPLPKSDIALNPALEQNPGYDVY